MNKTLEYGNLIKNHEYKLGFKSKRISVGLKSFKWHGIPVNIPNKKNEWRLLGLLLLVEVLVVIIVIVFLIAG